MSLQTQWKIRRGKRLRKVEDAKSIRAAWPENFPTGQAGATSERRSCGRLTGAWIPQWLRLLLTGLSTHLREFADLPFLTWT